MSLATLFSPETRIRGFHPAWEKHVNGEITARRRPGRRRAGAIVTHDSARIRGSEPMRSLRNTLEDRRREGNICVKHMWDSPGMQCRRISTPSLASYVISRFSLLISVPVLSHPVLLFVRFRSIRFRVVSPLPL